MLKQLFPGSDFTEAIFEISQISKHFSAMLLTILSSAMKVLVRRFNSVSRGRHLGTISIYSCTRTPIPTSKFCRQRNLKKQETNFLTPNVLVILKFYLHIELVPCKRRT